jgi:hypothetical protein
VQAQVQVQEQRADNGKNQIQKSNSKTKLAGQVQAQWFKVPGSGFKVT